MLVLLFSHVIKYNIVRIILSPPPVCVDEHILEKNPDEIYSNRNAINRVRNDFFSPLYSLVFSLVVH